MPPYAPDIPLSVFVARVSASSLRRSEIHVPSPPPSSPSASSGPRLAPPASDTNETATALRTVDGSTRWSLSSWTVPTILAGRPKTCRSTPTSIPAPAVTATHHRLPSHQPGFFGSVNHRFVPPFTRPRNAKAANASTTPNTAAYPISGQNPRDRVSGMSEPGCDSCPGSEEALSLTNSRSSPAAPGATTQPPSADSKRATSADASMTRQRPLGARPRRRSVAIVERSELPRDHANSRSLSERSSRSPAHSSSST